MKTFKAITLSLLILLATSLVNVKEIRAEGVKKINSKSTEQNKRVTTEYKSELVDKIIKAYKLDPKNNPKDQCTLTNVLDNMIWLPFFGQFSTIKNQNYVQQSKKQLSFRI